ncbi:hypothetical protein E4U53_002219 [Claviceps sorghi]|nr:hypothetical protein E4U53_002219 [Claviceps sorghi]
MLQEDNVPVDDAVDDDGPDAPRPSYNFAPGYRGVVYRADTPDWGAGPGSHDKDDADGEQEEAGGAQETETETQPQPQPTRYKLQAMKWGLVPSWTRRKPDHATVMRTINCRDDSLRHGRGLWTSMKKRKRCVVLAQGFYEWRTTGRHKQPHYVTRPDGRLMCFAGLWDCVRPEGADAALYTYTIVTTEASAPLRFLHDRMPVVLDPGSDAMRAWVDAGRWTWSADLQRLLRPFAGPLRVYPVRGDVGKVGNDSPSLVVPLDSTENPSNIANFFARAHGGEHAGDDADASARATTKRKSPPVTGAAGPAPSKKTAGGRSRSRISATRNEHRSPAGSAGAAGSRKITSFFGHAA